MRVEAAMKTLFAWLEEHKDWTVEFLRMYLGLVLILKGIYFIRDMDQLLALIGLSASIWVGGLFAHYIVLAHLLGGLFVILGLITRYAVAAQLPILAGAVVIAYLREGWMAQTSNFEFTSLVFLLLVLFLFYGGGRLSVDYLLEHARNR
jgi:putative oxidoreductase